MEFASELEKFADSADDVDVLHAIRATSIAKQIDAGKKVTL